MEESAPNFPTVHGKITHGPKPNALTERTAEFIYAELPGWRDRPGRNAETEEERLNAQLARHLNQRARDLNFPVIFSHEEKQSTRRRVDIAVTPSAFGGAIVGSLHFGFDDPFLVVEGKRLPSPGGKARKREYVTGEPQISGGIQRFKLSLHGGNLDQAILIGYIQSDAPGLWHRRINGWIRALARRRPTAGRERWESSETLTALAIEPCRTSRCTSEHRRTTSPIRLQHMWVEM